MAGVVDLIFAPLQIFVWHPDRIAVVGASFLILVAWLYYVRRQLAWPAFLAASAWLAFAAWESWAKATKADIRVDLMPIWPVLIPLTIYGVVASFRRKSLTPPSPPARMRG